MRPVGTRMEAILCTTTLCALVAMLALPAFAASGLPADTEQLFGVGTKADAMGDAFVALANDPTAVFWNPAGLSFLQATEVTAVTKTLPRVTQTTDIRPDPADFSGFNTLETDGTSTHVGATDATFVSISTPVGKQHGVIALSRSLAGYLDRDSILAVQFNANDPDMIAASTITMHDTLRVDYNALTYGWKPAGTWSAGIGIVQAVADASKSGMQADATLGDPTNPTLTPIPSASTTGRGYGCILGTLWNPAIKGAGQLTLGGSYMTKITLSDFNSSRFGDERPDRLLVGANYRQPVLGSENEVQWSLQLSRNGKANSGDGDPFVRNAVWNFYAGGEYDIHRAELNLPVRYGLFTNKSPNDSLYGNETWMTLGLGAGQTKAQWQAEFALQEGLRTGQSLMSLSGGYSF